MIEHVGMGDGVSAIVTRAVQPSIFTSWELWLFILIIAGISAFYLRNRNGGNKKWKNENYRLQY